MKNEKTIKFYVALWLAKLSTKVLKLLKRNATSFPGDLAIKICPNFLGILEKPEIIIGVTGTNGKTTVSNMINDILIDNGYDLVNNKYGSNIDRGITTTLINAANLHGKTDKRLAVLEIDERSANKVYPYLTPNYLICTNIFRDSLMRNGHTEFIADILNKYIPKETIMIENADDLICSHIAENNKKVYFGIDKLDTDTENFENRTRDIMVCPKCYSKLEYDYVRYHHIGKAHCPNCDYKTPDANYLATKLDLQNMKMTIKTPNGEEEYTLITNNIINIYNIVAVIALLKEFGLNYEQINTSLAKLKIVETRFSDEIYNGVRIVTHLAKGMNPIACSRAFDYARKEPGNKAAIVIVDDLHEEKFGSENTSWQYDTDYEFLNDPSIKQVIVAGPRYLDAKVRLLMAGVPNEKIVCKKDEIEATQGLNLNNIDSVFILHDLYSIEETKNIKNAVKQLIDKKGNESNEN